MNKKTKSKVDLVGQQKACFRTRFCIFSYSEPKNEGSKEQFENFTPPILHQFFKMHRYSCKIILRTDRPRKDGTCKLYLQAFINGEKIAMSLDVATNPAYFNIEKEKAFYPPKATPEEKKEIDDLNLILNLNKAKATGIFKNHRMSDILLTKNEFEKKFKHTFSDYDFIGFMQDEMKHMGTDIVKGTLTNYTNTIKKLKLYKIYSDKQSGIRNSEGKILFSDINFNFVSGFDKWLKTKDSQHINSAWRHHRTLRTFINIARKKKLQIEYPYNEFKAKTVFTEPTYLTRAEVDKLMQLYEQNKLSGPLQRTLQMFLFACWTSLRISDVGTITADQIISDELVFIPSKGRRKKKIVRVPITVHAKQFIMNSTGKLFDTIADKQLNKDLKIIAAHEDVKLTKKLTFHVARHTFAMMFLEVEKNKVEVLKEIMGHSDIKTTMIYVHIQGQHKKDSMNRMDLYAKQPSDSPE